MPTGLGTELAWWCPSLQDDSSLSIVTDLSGNGNDLTNFSTTSSNWVTDTDEGGVRAVHLDGSTQYHQCTTSPIVTDIYEDCTISIWVKLDSGTSSAVFASRHRETDQTWITNIDAQVALYDASDGTSARLRTDTFTGGIIAAIDNTTPPTTDWMHVISTARSTSGETYSGSREVKLYIDGVLVDTDTGIVNRSIYTMFTVGAGKRIGGGTYSPLDGRWDDCRVFGEILDQTEIERLSTSRGIEGSAAPESRTSPYAKNFLFLDFI